MEPAEEPVIDPDLLRETLGPDPEDVDAMLPGFLDAAAKQLDDFMTAVEAGDDERARQAIHSLGSSLGFIGAMRLSGYAREVESEMHTRPDADPARHINALREGWETLQQALDSLDGISLPR